MNKEEMPTYGELYAENFRLKHNERVLLDRIDKAIEYIKEQGCYEEDNKQFCDDIDYYKLTNLLEILRGTKDENN